jgi:hypothetical protein
MHNDKKLREKNALLSFAKEGGLSLKVNSILGFLGNKVTILSIFLLVVDIITDSIMAKTIHPTKNEFVQRKLCCI